jgi:hypothetical protein
MGQSRPLSLDLKEGHYNDGHCSRFLIPFWLCLPFSFSFPPSFFQSPFLLQFPSFFLSIYMYSLLLIYLCSMYAFNLCLFIGTWCHAQGLNASVCVVFELYHHLMYVLLCWCLVSMLLCCTMAITLCVLLCSIIIITSCLSCASALCLCCFIARLPLPCVCVAPSPCVYVALSPCVCAIIVCICCVSSCCALHHHFVSMPCVFVVSSPYVYIAPLPCVYIASSLCVCAITLCLCYCAIAINLCLCHHHVSMLCHRHQLITNLYLSNLLLLNGRLKLGYDMPNKLIFALPGLSSIFCYTNVIPNWSPMYPRWWAQTPTMKLLSNFSPIALPTTTHHASLNLTLFAFSILLWIVH